jgi:hypothetical protein
MIDFLNGAVAVTKVALVALAVVASGPGCDGGEDGGADAATSTSDTTSSTGGGGDGDTSGQPNCFCNVTVQCDPQCSCDPDCADRQPFGGSCGLHSDCRDEDSGPEDPYCHNNTCTQTCTFSSACPQGHGCRAIATDKVCTPGQLGAFGATCNNDSDCADPGYSPERPKCVSNLCSRTCRFSAECPIGTACDTFGTQNCNWQ